MKLLFCVACDDVVKFGGNNEWRDCHCGKSSGRYIDSLYAEIKGEGIPIGFNNSSLVRAIRNRPEHGLGLEFTAFVIQKECDTIKQL